jgi:DNA polymerase elongation subunit (family B)
MLEHIKLSNILFLDIETVSQYPSFDQLPDRFKLLWEKKALTLRSVEDQDPVTNYSRAGIYAEFGKVICISCGYFTSDKIFRLTSFSSHDEEKILREFAIVLKDFCSSEQKLLCAHNGKEFDFPFLARRMVILGIPLPAVLNTPGKKPWEVNHLDTLELWKFGDYKSYTSLALLAAVFGIPTPKDDIDGSQVGEVYWKENDLDRIKNYCQKDVITIAQIMLKFRGEALISEDKIERVSIT